jgi:hypothetical protein
MHLKVHVLIRILFWGKGTTYNSAVLSAFSGFLLSPFSRQDDGHSMFKTLVIGLPSPDVVNQKHG